MEVVIVEDERLSADKLTRMLRQYEPSADIVAIDSVKNALQWFRENSPPDLMFLDIQLNDGTGFDLLKEIKNSPPVIFTTAFDQYAIKAFKFNSVDYLLKPINQDELRRALDKFHKYKGDLQTSPSHFVRIDHILNGNFKKRFLIKIGEQYQSIEVNDIAFFMYDDGLTYLYTLNNRWPTDHSLESLENMLHPLEFFRVNRKTLTSMGAIKQIHSYFNSRLLLKLIPETNEDIIVSRDRVGDFKRWMDL